MDHQDIETLVKRDFVDRSVSKNDPYFEKMNHAAKREYKLLHPAVQRTEDLLDKFAVNELKDFAKKKDVAQMYKTIDERYYIPKISAKNRIGAIFTAKVLDSLNVSKHERVRRDKKEKAKLDYLDSELQQSPRLK